MNMGIPIDPPRRTAVAIERMPAGKSFSERGDFRINDISSDEDLQAYNINQHYVANALKRLTPKQRIVLELLYFEGLTQEEIATGLGEPVGTIKSRVRSALMKLRFHFAKKKLNKPDSDKT